MIYITSFIGKPPEYWITCIKQIRLFTCDKIYCITDHPDSDVIQTLQKISNTYCVDYNMFRSLKFEHLVAAYRKKFVVVEELNDRKELFMRSLERFFLCENLMHKMSLFDVIFLEIDNMIYADASKFIDLLRIKPLAYMFDNFNRSSSGIMYIKNVHGLKNLNAYLVEYIINTKEFLSEMLGISEFASKYPTEVQYLPIHNETSKYPKICSNFISDYKYIFDAAPIGVYICGNDTFHTGGNYVTGQKNLWSLIDFNNYSISWKLDQLNRSCPYIKFSDNQEYPIFNLHVHSKALDSVYSGNNGTVSVKLDGGLGNQLFQLAFLDYIAKSTNKIPKISSLISPTTSHSKNNYFDSIFKTWNNPENLCSNIPFFEINDSKSYEQIPDTIPRNILCAGYFQNYKYIRNDIRTKLSFNTDILDKYPLIKNSYFIHVRGGDYLDKPYSSVHYIDLSSYYRKCLDLCVGEEIVIFTNDKEYANKVIPGNFTIINESEIDTLYLMSQCKGCICSNSTFSWWGAYLNPDRPIYMPSKWFAQTMSNTSNFNFYFPGVIIVDIDIDMFNQIDKVVYINLKERTDRKISIEKELNSVFSKDKIIRFEAIKHVHGAVGCTISHLSVLGLAIKNNWRNVLIVEDDMKWNNLPTSSNILNNLMKKQFDVIGLGGTFVEYDESTYRAKKFSTSTAYIVNNHYFKTLRNNIAEGLNQLVRKPDMHSTFALDMYWKKLQERDNWYIIHPPMSIQAAGYSDIQKRDVNYDEYFGLQISSQPKSKPNKLWGNVNEVHTKHYKFQ